MYDNRPLNQLDTFENKKVEILLNAEETDSESKIKLGSVLLRGSMIININEIK